MFKINRIVIFETFWKKIPPNKQEGNFKNLKIQ